MPSALVPLTYAEAVASAPPEWQGQDLLPAIREAGAGAQLVVLDDDPTGNQTMHDIPVLTHWDVSTLAGALSRAWPAVYVLTNSRSLPAGEAVSVNREVMTNLAEASSLTGRALRLLSRSDSTLRGHYPLETDAVAGALAAAGRPVHGLLLVPAFMEGGRFTLGGTHFVREGDKLTPAAATEFARDKAFGFTRSYLPEWVEEKTGGKIAAADVAVITLAEIRQGGPEAVMRKLISLPKGAVAALDALSYRDMEVGALALLKAEAAGFRFLSRTGAAFVRALAGLGARPLLAPAEIAGKNVTAGGLCVVGSYVRKSSEQLARLLEVPGVEAVELNVARVLAPESGRAEAGRAADAVRTALAAGRDVVLYSSRELLHGATPEESLAIGRRVSDTLTDIVAHLGVRPRFLIAKGGITAHDLANRGLNVRVAMVRGQVLPGVPVWELGPEALYPGLSYVVFPGNVGGPDDLAGLFRSLRAGT
ncbi:MAG TPA: four-carbon acid sugar kinase family protein [Symbiobacteriaceae bacterium]|jgi:uncharacterized protein YgbK (DUF1537 family)